MIETIRSENIDNYCCEVINIQSSLEQWKSFEMNEWMNELVVKNITKKKSVERGMARQGFSTHTLPVGLLQSNSKPGEWETFWSRDARRNISIDLSHATWGNWKPDVITL